MQRRNWTREEEAYLAKYAGMYRIDVIAKNLDRTSISVELKMKRMGLSNTRDQVGLITMGELARLLGVDRNTVKHWADRHKLPYIKRKTKKEKTFYFVDTNRFWDWADNNREKVDFSRIERHAIPPEPKWVEPLRQERKETRYKPWTIQEEKQLLEQMKHRKPLADIAKSMNRSLTSVERKYYRIKNIRKIN